MAKESKTREALKEAAMNMIFAGCDALAALEGAGAEDEAHNMVDWHFNRDDDENEEESFLSN